MPCDERTKHYVAALDALEERFGGFPRGALEMLFALTATHDLFLRFASAIAERSDLSFAGFRVLTMIAKEEGGRCPMHRLSEWLFVSRQNVTGLVDVLEKKGLVRRSGCGADRRVKWVELTEEGRATLDHVLPELFGSTRQLFAGYPDDDLTVLVEALGRLRARILAVGPEVEPGFQPEVLCGAEEGESAPSSTPRPARGRKPTSRP